MLALKKMNLAFLKQKPILAGLILVLIGIGLVSISSRPKKEITPLPTPVSRFPTATPTTELRATLSLLPQTTQVLVNQTFSVDILLDTQDAKVDAADAILSFDPKILSVENLVTGDFFDVFPVVASRSGEVQISALVSPKEGKPQTVSGKGKVGTVFFKGLTPGLAKVDFSSNCVVAEKGKNVLGDSIGGSYTIR